MHLLYFVLFLLAVCCFVLSAVSPWYERMNARRLDFVALGLALAVSVFMIQQARLL